MVLLVKQLIERKVFVLAVKEPVENMEHKVIRHDAKQNVFE
jgi:hypothetical protein